MNVSLLARTEHPNPMLRRPVTSLDGEWEFALEQGPFDRTIEVPFAPETPASGVGATRVERCAYRRRVPMDAPGPGERLLLHFGAVDRTATVLAGGEVVAIHEGGYTAFTADVTDAGRRGQVELEVRVEDDPDDLEAPRGKQDWLDEAHSIWYPRTTGIWRSVWLERVPACHVQAIHWTCDVTSMTVAATVQVAGSLPGSSIGIALRHGERIVASGTSRIAGGAARLVLTVGDGGIDERWELLWWPRRPVLLDAEVVLLDGEGSVVDRAMSYTALRDVAVSDGRFLINGRDTFLRLVLDQGYWPDTGLTPPDANALRRDLELARSLGFNGVRKHQKVEDPRFLALADELGMLVWVEMPSAYRHSTLAAQRLLREWADVVMAARNHPSVMAWVPMNESWGVPGIATDQRQRSVAEALANIARALDGTRPVSVNDGWETSGGEIVGVHDYTQNPSVLAARYANQGAIDQVLCGVGPSGYRVDLDRRPAAGRAVVLSEFGGINLLGGDGQWGYATATSAADLLDRYRAQWAAVHQSTALAGACWTQLTDTYQEANGLLTMDRTPKADPDAIARATRGRG